MQRRRTTHPDFNLPYTDKQMYATLYAACRAEVELRRRTFAPTDAYRHHIMDVARWLVDKDKPTFGLYLCGNRGNGKTTMARALQNMYHWLTSDNSNDHNVFRFITAKELVRLAKDYNNPTRDNGEAVNAYRKLRDTYVLCIDDLGTEPRESMHYGDFVTAAIDMINYRYDQRLTTIATSNLAPGELREYYDERFADRLREMMHIVNFGQENSYRTSDVQ